MAVGRLENIAARNRSRPFHRDRIAVGITSLVLLVVVGLLAFTAMQSDPAPAPTPPVAAPASTPADHRVRDIKLYKAPTKTKTLP